MIHVKEGEGDNKDTLVLRESVLPVMDGGGKRAGTGFLKAMLYLKKWGAFNLTRGSWVQKRLKNWLGFSISLSRKKNVKEFVTCIAEQQQH